MTKKIKYIIFLFSLVVISFTIVTYLSNKECYKMNMDKFGKAYCFNDLLKKVEYWGVCNNNATIPQNEINPDDYFVRPFVTNKGYYEETCKNTERHSVRIKCYEENCQVLPKGQVGGCGTSKSVVICDDKYFIEMSDQAQGPKLYGPFTLN